MDRRGIAVCMNDMGRRACNFFFLSYFACLVRQSENLQVLQKIKLGKKDIL